MCEESLAESLCVENSCDLLCLADTYSAEQLRYNAVEFILALVRFLLFRLCNRIFTHQDTLTKCTQDFTYK